MRKIFVILVILIVLGIGGYLLWNQRTAIEGWIRGKIIEFFTQDGIGGNLSVPEITTAPESLGATPNVNPIDKTNPFKDIKTNPFE